MLQPDFQINVLALLFGYLLGSIPFGLIFTRLAGTEDLRSVGSGNIGATNVLRTGRKGLAAATLLADALKGTLAVVIAAQFTPYAAIIAGLGAFIGHLYPIWLKGKGGKGVATYIGVLLALAWPVFLIFALLWLAVAFTMKYSSLAALVASFATPIALFLMGHQQAGELFIALTILLWFRHWPNIQKLMDGTESKIGDKA